MEESDYNIESRSLEMHESYLHAAEAFINSVSDFTRDIARISELQLEYKIGTCDDKR